MKKIFLAVVLIFSLSLADDSILDKIKDGASKTWEVTKEYTKKGYEKTKEAISDKDDESFWDKTKKFGIKVWDTTKEYSKKGYEKAKVLLNDDK